MSIKKPDPAITRLINAAHKDPKELQKRIQAAWCERPGGLRKFIEIVWPTVEPAVQFMPNWHIDCVAEHLEAVTNGQITRLAINVPPGSMKPVCVDSKVTMANGSRKRLGDIRKGEQIINGLGDIADVIEVHEQGKLECVKITTAAGREIVAAYDHPILTPEGWVDAGDLSIGQSVAVRGYRKNNGRGEKRRDDEFILSGFLTGDGNVTQGRGGLSATFCSETKENLDQCRDAAIAMGFSVRESKPSGYKNDFWRFDFSNGVRDWLRDIDMAGKSSRTKRVPDFVFEGTDQQVAKFIAAYFQCDGCVEKQHKTRKQYFVSIGSVSKGLLEDVRHLLLRFGIHARIRTTVIKRKTGKAPIGYTTYHLRVASVDGLVRFAKNIPVVGPKRIRLDENEVFLEYFDRNMIPDKIEIIERGILSECRCLTVSEGRSFLAEDVIVSNSLLTGVFWPAWEWTRFPHLRYLCFSYSQYLTLRDNNKFRNVITSEIYRELWGDVFQPSKDVFSATQVGNDKTGVKTASSVGGVGLGARADRLIVDDPNSAMEVESDLVRDTTNTWWSEVIPTRLNNFEKSAIILIQQRVHQMDVTGFTMDKGMGYEHLVIPIEYDSTRRYVTSIGWTDPRGIDPETGDEIDNDGALMWPERYSPKVVEKLKSDMGPVAFAGQFNQSPVPRGGAIFDTTYINEWPGSTPVQAEKYIERSPTGDPYRDRIKFPQFEYVVACVDTAFTEKEENNPSAMTVWGVFRDVGTRMAVPTNDWREGQDNPVEFLRLVHDQRPKAMLMYAWEKRLALHGPPEHRPAGISDKEWNEGAWLAERQQSWGLVEWVTFTAKKYGIDMLLIEVQGQGNTLEKELRRLNAVGDWGIQMVSAHGGKGAPGKVARAHAVTHLFSNGLIYVPRHPETGQYPAYVELALRQLEMFPRGKNDDVLDACVWCLAHLRDTGILVRGEEHDEEYGSLLRVPQRNAPLYEV